MKKLKIGIAAQEGCSPPDHIWPDDWLLMLFLKTEYGCDVTVFDWKKNSWSHSPPS